MPPIVLIHGMCCTPKLWANYAGVFRARGFDVHAPALRWHDVPPGGPAPPAVGTTSLLDYASDLEKLIKSLPEKPVLVGHSMGGLLAQILAARGLARAAVLLTPAAPAGVWGLALAHVPAITKISLRGAFWRQPLLPTRREAFWVLLNKMPPADAEALYRAFVQESGRALFEIAFWPLDRQRAARVPAARVPAARVTCPLLIIGARDDRATPVSVVRRVARRYSTATYVELPGHAHWVLGEPGWEKIAQRCMEWIEATVGVQAGTRA